MQALHTVESAALALCGVVTSCLDWTEPLLRVKCWVFTRAVVWITAVIWRRHCCDLEVFVMHCCVFGCLSCSAVIWGHCYDPEVFVDPCCASEVLFALSGHWAVLALAVLVAGGITVTLVAPCSVLLTRLLVGTVTAF